MDTENAIKKVWGLIEKQKQTSGTSELAKEMEGLEIALREVSNAQAELVYMAEKRAEHKNQIEALNAEIADRKAKLAEADKELAAEHEKLKTEYETKRKVLVADVATLEGKFNTLVASLAKAKQEMNDVVNERRRVLAGVETETNRASATFQGLKEQAKKLREQLEAI